MVIALAGAGIYFGASSIQQAHAAALAYPFPPPPSYSRDLRDRLGRGDNRGAIPNSLDWLLTQPRTTGRSPTGSTSEAPVSMSNQAMPWETGSGDGKYKYQPRGDSQAEPRDAPSALNVTVIPNVNLPKVRDERGGLISCSFYYQTKLIPRAPTFPVPTPSPILPLPLYREGAQIVGQAGLGPG